MSDAIISVVLTLLAKITEERIRKEIRLVSGVEKDVKKLISSYLSIKAVLVDAEKRQVTDESVKLWLVKLTDVSYDTEVVLSEWITAIREAETGGNQENQSSPTYKKVCSFVTLPCLCLNRVTLRRDIALKIKEINERLDVIAVEKDRYKFDVLMSSDCTDRLRSTSFIDESRVQGRDLDKSALLGKLLLPENNQDKILNIVSIVGVYAIGKTTLAQVVFNSSAVIDHFDRRIWVCVSEPFDEIRIATAILEDIESSCPNLFELETAMKKIRQYVEGNKLLLVLDDVRTEDFRKWEQLFNSLSIGAAGSTILVTTRNERVAKVMGSNYELSLGELPREDSWALFSKIAFHGRSREECEELDDIGKQIAEKCRGLPLTVKKIAHRMRSKRTVRDWEDVLSSELKLEGGKALLPPQNVELIGSSSECLQTQNG